MPTYIRKSPSEFAFLARAKKKVYETEKESNLSSGFSGTPLADSETYDSLVKSFDEIINEIEAYFSLVLIFVGNDGNAPEPNPTDLFKALNKTGQIVSKISLGALTPKDIQVLQDYKESIGNGYYTSLESQVNPILTIARLAGPRGGQPKARSEAIATTISDKILPDIDNLFRDLDAKIVSFNSGKAQPMKVGSGFDIQNFASSAGEPMSGSGFISSGNSNGYPPVHMLMTGGKFDPYESLRGHDMFKSSKYVI